MYFTILHGADCEERVRGCSHGCLVGGVQIGREHSLHNSVLNVIKNMCFMPGSWEPGAISMKSVRGVVHFLRGGVCLWGQRGKVCIRARLGSRCGLESRGAKEGAHTHTCAHTHALQGEFCRRQTGRTRPAGGSVLRCCRCTCPRCALKPRTGMHMTAPTLPPARPPSLPPSIHQSFLPSRPPSLARARSRSGSFDIAIGVEHFWRI